MINRLRSSSLGAILSLGIIFNINIATISSVATTAVVVPVVAVMTLPAKSCDKDDYVAAAEDVLAVVSSSSVMAALKQASPFLAAQLEKAKPAAQSLVQAIKDGDFSRALGYINLIFPLVDQIAAALKANQKVLGFIALANIALHFILNRLKREVPTSAARSPELAQTLEYSTQPVWGCDYRKDKRCQ